MADLATMLASGAPLAADQVIEAMLTASATPDGVFDPGFDLLIPPISKADEVIGDSYMAQLVIARRLARGFDSKASGRAHLSLVDLLRGVKNNLRLENFPKPITAPLLLGGKSLRGHHWKLDCGGNERSKKISLPPPIEGDETSKLLAQVDGRFSFLGSNPDDIFEDFFVSDKFPLLKKSDIPTAAMAGHIGSRPSQQDYSLVIDVTLPTGLSVRLAMVADGHLKNGEYASKMGSWFFVKRFLENLLLHPQADIYDAGVQALRYADAKIQEIYEEAGTTFTAYVQAGDKKYLVHVGDSQAHFISDGGKDSKVTISHFGKRSGDYWMLRALGERNEKARRGSVILGEPDIYLPTVVAGGLLILSSDGVNGNLGEWALQNSDGSPQSVADAIIEGMLSFNDPHQDNMMALAIRHSKD